MQISTCLIVSRQSLKDFQRNCQEELNVGGTRRLLTLTISYQLFLPTMRHDGLTLKANLNIMINRYLDTVFAVHSDFQSNIKACIILGKGAITSISPQ